MPRITALVKEGEYYAILAVAGSITITCNLDLTHGLGCEAFAVSGANTASPFDSYCTSISSSVDCTLTTSNALDFVYGLGFNEKVGYFTPTINAPPYMNLQYPGYIEIQKTGNFYEGGSPCTGAYCGIGEAECYNSSPCGVVTSTGTYLVNFIILGTDYEATIGDSIISASSAPVSPSSGGSQRNNSTSPINFVIPGEWDYELNTEFFIRIPSAVTVYAESIAYNYPGTDRIEFGNISLGSVKGPMWSFGVSVINGNISLMKLGSSYARFMASTVPSSTLNFTYFYPYLPYDTRIAEGTNITIPESDYYSVYSSWVSAPVPAVYQDPSSNLLMVKSTYAHPVIQFDNYFSRFVSSISIKKAGVLNPDCGKCLIAGGKFYQFFANIADVNGTSGLPINLVEFKFSDGLHTIRFGYDNTTRNTQTYEGSDYIEVGIATVNSSRMGGEMGMSVLIPVALRNTILDDGNVTLQLYVQLSNGTYLGFTPVELNLIIINQGGAVTTTTHGNATAIPVNGQFACSVSETGWCATNSTWYGLQYYQTQFSILLGDKSGHGDAELWQPYQSAGIHENYTMPGDWKIAVHWYYWDGSAWVDGWHVVISMQTGNQGGSDEWTTLQVVWYNRDTLVKNDSVSAWLEQGSEQGAITGQIRIFLDMWFSNDNASTVHGGNVQAYYFGAHEAGYLWWGSWSPYPPTQEASLVYGQNLNSTGGVVSAQDLLCSKIGWNVSRTISSSYPSDPNIYPLRTFMAKYFYIFTNNFAIEKFLTAIPSSMAGIATPNFVVTQMPNLPSSGFLTPLYSALASLASAIWSVISKALAGIWAGLGARFPWFTDFWIWVYGGITGFFGLLMDFANMFAALLGWIAGLFGFLTPIFNMFGSAFGFIQRMFYWVPLNEAPQIIELLLIIIFGMSLMEAAVTGDWPWIINFAKTTWHFVEAVFRWTLWLVNSVVSVVEGLIP